MPSILVVEHEGRYIERIQDALSSEGWHPRFVAGRPEALRAAASEAPNLVLVNAELPGAAELLRSFARSQGGPGAVALLGEGGGGEGLEADELLAKPFSDQELRLVVRRRLAAAEKGPAPAPAAPAAAAGEPVGDDHKLTSAEIFGDLLAEVEQEVASDDRRAGVDAPPPPSAARARDEDVELLLERTLSGVPGMAKRRKGSSPSEAPPPREEPPQPERDEPAWEEPPPQVPPQPPHRDPRPDRPPQGDPPPRTARSVRASDDDVDELLNMTLSGLRLGSLGTRRATAPASAPPAAKPKRTVRQGTGEIDLSELEAFAGRGRRRKEAGGGDAAPPSPPPPASAPERADPPEVGSEPGVEAGRGAAPSLPSPSEPQPPPPPTRRSVEAPEAESPPPPPPSAADVVPSTPPAPADEHDGRRFGHYRLLERIAVGGMAEVWKARMSGVEGFQKTVAIKRILPHMNDDSDFVDMFIDEAKLAAQLNHPNITHIYDLGKIGDDYYIAMEYVDGRNLRAILNESRRKALKLPVGFALLVAARLASALDYAHRKRDFDDRDLELVHRDVSPQNVLISSDGDIKLCDFGISKAVAKLNQTETGALKGKLQYMSPEQAWGRTVDARSDLFSLGALTFEMLTGERLFTGDSEISVLEAVRECRVRRPGQVAPEVPARVEAVVVRALEREPADRYANAGEMLQALEAVLYDLRPTPSQADIAAFLARLEAAPEVRPGTHPTSPGTGTGSLSNAGSSPLAAPLEAPDAPAPTATPRPVSTLEADRPASSEAASGGAQDATGTGAKRLTDLEQDASPAATQQAAPGSGEPTVAANASRRREGDRSDGGDASAPDPPATSAPTTGEGERTGRWWRFGPEPSATTEPKEKEESRAAAAVLPLRPDPRAAAQGGDRAVAPPAGATIGANTGATSPGSSPGSSAAPPATTAPPAVADPDATATSSGVDRPAIVARGEVAEEAGRGRWMLIATILLFAVLAVATWLWLERPGRTDSGSTAGPAAEEPTETIPEAGSVTEPEAEAAAGPAATAEPEIDLERLVEEELARKEQEVRRQAEEDYRETARRIQAEIDSLSRRQATPPPPPQEPDETPEEEEPPSPRP